MSHVHLPNLEDDEEESSAEPSPKTPTAAAPEVPQKGRPRSSWLVKVALEALLDPQLAFAVSRIYGLQQTYQQMTGGIMQAVYLKSMTENFEAFTHYYGDIVLWEPVLLRMYDEVLPQIDRALGESSSEGNAGK